MKPLFFDIETAGIAKDFDSLTPEMQDAWKLTGKDKPWEVNILDLQEIWKQNGFNSCKFNSACVFLGIESPKDDIDGSQVHEAFWNGEIERIKTYCEKDVISLHKMYNKIIHLL